MSHERTKSEDERLLAALAALDVEQNINNANTIQQPLSAAAEVAAEDIEGARNQASVPAGISADDLPFANSYARRNGFGLSRVNKIKQQKEYQALSSPNDPFANSYARRNKFGLSRVDTIKQQKEYQAVSSPNDPFANSYARRNEFGLSRVDTIKQQKEYQAVSSPNDPFANTYARRNEFGLSRVDTIKQQMEYNALLSPHTKLSVSLYPHNKEPSLPHVDMIEQQLDPSASLHTCNNDLSLLQAQARQQQLGHQATTPDQNDTNTSRSMKAIIPQRADNEEVRNTTCHSNH